MSNFYYYAYGAENIVNLRTEDWHADSFYEAMSEVCRISKERKIKVELWHSGFDGNFKLLTTACPEFKYSKFKKK